jgi:uncharacterized RDD family membrane protein YckC
MDMDAQSSHAPEEHPAVAPAVGIPDDQQPVLGRRVAAAVIDLVCLTAVAIAIAAMSGGTETGNGSASFLLTGLAFAVFAVVAFGYYFVLEATLGRTIGKALLSLRVVDRGDERPTVLAVAGRTVLRAVDWLPAFYLVGFVTMLITGRRRRRLGDLVAGTRVVRTAPARRRGVAGLALAGLVVVAIAAFSVAGMVRSGFVTAGTSSSSSCVSERCNATAGGDQVMELSGRQVAISGIDDGRATFEVDGDRVELTVGEARQVGDSLVRLTSVEGDVATFSIDFSGLFVDRADLETTVGSEETTMYRSYADVTDEQGVITVELPGEWSDVGAVENPDVASSIHAAPDLQRFRSGWDVPGIIIDVAPREGSDDIPAIMKQLGPAGQCTTEGRDTHETDKYIGRIERWSSCAGGDTRAVTAAVATTDGRALVSVFGQAVDDRDVEAIERALRTLEIGQLPRMSDQEWLAAVIRLREQIDRGFWATGSELDAPAMRSMARVLSSCGRELRSLGAPSDRLERAHTLASRACRRFQRGAKCLRTAARIGIPLAGSEDDRKQSEAIDCGFDAANRGSELLLQAEIAGDEAHISADPG